MSDYKIEKVHLSKQEVPEDYHCDCKFCQKFKGVLIRKDGSKYSKLERRKYYDTEAEKAHIAKTPLHIARWAIQKYTKEGDWVLDPTMGAGTTAVEALMQKRNAAGVEIQFLDVIKANVKKCNPYNMEYQITEGDARKLLNHLDMNELFIDPHYGFSLIINNPPYSGDENQTGIGKDRKTSRYDREKSGNLAFMKENEEYWETFEDIYGQAASLLKKGGRFIIGVKDMIRKKQPYLIHKYYGEVLLKVGLKYEGMVLLPHYPTTLFMNTYNKRFPDLDIKVPRYQTILIFKKK